MSSTDKGAEHPLGLNNLDAVQIRGSGGDTQIKAKWSDIYQPEESGPDGEGIVGGEKFVGMGGSVAPEDVGDVLGSDNIDPESAKLLKDYELYTRRKGTLPFQEWLDTEDKAFPEKSIPLHLVTASSENPATARISKSLKAIWEDPSAKVSYLIVDKDDPSKDRLVFVGDSLKKVQDGWDEFGIGVAEFNQILGKDNVRMQIDRRPRGDWDKHAVMGVLKHLRIDDKVFTSDKFAVAYGNGLEKSKVDETGYNLGINRRRIQGILDGGKNDFRTDEERVLDIRDAASVEKFWKTWIQTKDGKNNIDAIGFGVENGKLSTAIMKLKDGRSITFRIHFWRAGFDGVSPYGDPVKGFSVKNLKGDRVDIGPSTPQGELDAAMGNLKINGVQVPEGTRFFIGDLDRSSQVGYSAPSERVPVEEAI